MRILFLHSLADPELGGGAEVVVWEQILGMRNAGHQCVLVATSDKPGLERTDRDGITVWKVGIRNVYWPYHKKRPPAPWRLIWHALDSYNPWMQRYLREIVTREKPDVASLHNLTGWSAASWRTLAQLGVPVVQVLHDHYSICAKAAMYKNDRNCSVQCAGCRLFRLPHRRLSRCVQAVVGVSRYILNRHRSLGYFDGVSMQRVVHNARSPEELGIGKVLSPPHEGLRFGYIGRLDPAKGIELLIDAFLSADLPDAELWIAGSGRQHDEERLYRKTVDTRVRFIGRLEPRNFYPQVDVVIVPSLLNESLGMVVAEALAFGKPVIGSRRGGILEMIREEVNGLLFDPDMPDSLKSALQAMADDGLRMKLAAQTRLSARPFIDVSGWVSTYELVYQELLSQAKSPSLPKGC